MKIKKTKYNSPNLALKKKAILEIIEMERKKIILFEFGQAVSGKARVYDF